jgi:hypothetical protein
VSRGGNSRRAERTSRAQPRSSSSDAGSHRRKSRIPWCSDRDGETRARRPAIRGHNRDTAAQRCHAPQFRVLARSHDRMAAVRLHAGVAGPMTVSAYENALVGLRSGAFDASEEAAECEVLGGRVAVVELQRRDRARVAALLAAPATGVDKLSLDPDPPAPAVADPRLQAARAGIHQRPTRTVVRAERRAGGAEAAAAQLSELAIDDHAGGKRGTARRADLH